MSEHVTESRWAWLTLWLRRAAYAEPRPATPREADLIDALDERDREIARIRAALDDARDEYAEMVREHLVEVSNQEAELEKKDATIAALEHDIELGVEYYQMAINEIKARSAAYAKLIPPEGK